MTGRVRQLLKQVHELELDPAEVKELRAGLDAYETCEIDLDGATKEERELLLTIKRRMDQFFRGEAKTVSMKEADAFIRSSLRRRRHERRSAG